MKEINLLLNPFWEGKDLGQSIPQSPHALSVSLPRWKDVIAYEEKDPLIKAYSAIYDGLFKSFSDIPHDIASHLRYPKDLFSVPSKDSI